MGFRLSKIVTRTGDDGSTGLADGTRVAKTDRRIEAMGCVDELNSWIGMLIVEVALLDPEGTPWLAAIQHRLFDLGSELCLPGQPFITEPDVAQLEDILARVRAPLPALKEFILPGGSRAAAVCHVARTVARRAERRTLALTEHPVSHSSMQYLNRLSDFLFLYARRLNLLSGTAETQWTGTR